MYHLKMSIVGDGAVGKTSLRERYLGKGFKSTYIMTVGADFSVKEEIVNNEILKFQIWDLAGQPKFASIRIMYYKGSKGFLIVFDVTRPDSYENVLVWTEEIKKYTKNDIPAILIGNKVDLREVGTNTDIISQELGEKMAKKVSEKLSNGKYPVTYIETSAKTGKNVEFGFRKLSEEVYNLFVKPIE